MVEAPPTADGPYSRIDDGKLPENPPQACIMPDGTICALSSTNPYVKAAQAAERARRAAEEETANLALRAEVGMRAFSLERRARVVRTCLFSDLASCQHHSCNNTHAPHPSRSDACAPQVRLLAVFDMVFSLTHAMVDTWPAAAASLMAFCGYLGATTFRRDLTRIYLVYLVLFALTRIALSLHVVLFAVESHAQGSGALSAYTAMAAFFQIFIAHFVYRFYSALPTNLNDARFMQFVSDSMLTLHV